ncbi:MAG: agmatinase [Methanobacteriota archaeon]
MSMKVPSYFADAESSFRDAEFVIYGVPYDRTSSFRMGAVQGPKEIRQAGWNFETFDVRTGIDLRDIRMHDYGDLDVDECQPREMIEKVRTFVSSVLKQGKFPVGLGGEHSVTAGVIQAFPKDIAVVSLDAHLDFREQYENESFNHACVIRRISDHIKIGHIAVLGIRSAEKEEFVAAQHQQLFFRDLYTIQQRSLPVILEETRRYLDGKKMYLTLDIDVIDPAYAPGTSTPEPYGFTPQEVRECLEFFSSDLVGFDVVEVCPPYDHGQTALLAARLIRTLIGAVHQSRA